MSRTFDKVRALVQRAEVRYRTTDMMKCLTKISSPGDVLAGVFNGIVVEDYPSYAKGPCVLVLQKDLNQQPIHVVWGIPKEFWSRTRIADPA